MKQAERLPSGDTPEGEEALEVTAAPRPLEAADQKRLRAIFDAHYDFTWRFLRRLGLDQATAEDGAQQVFMVVSRRLHDIEPGRERAFIAGTAVRVASRLRKSLRQDGAPAAEPEATREEPATDPTPEALVERKRQREMLDAILGELDEDLRVVLVLAEVDGFGKREIAEMLGIPEGTAASRLRRAREAFQDGLKRHLARRRSS